ncbi:MAG: hypothetical protein EKK49_07940 [Rhodocyclaceae bacterium]|nr:MAG: hypothetical protein EKK49_07940 [Rhodocyclaceae bacterium]
MSQQINLLVMKRSGSASALATLAVLGMLLVSLLTVWGVRQSALRAAQETEAASALQLQQATATLQARTQQKGLDAEIALLRPKAEAAQKFLAQMGELGSRQGYARYFSALTNASEEGVWLSSVTVDRAGKSVQVGGHALRKESVMRYAQRLNTLFIEDGVQFTSLELTLEAAGSKPGDAPRPATATAFKLY